MSEHDDVLEEAAGWLEQGRKVALATVIETWGSAPRPVGSQLAIRDDATFVGSVSGGCIEGDVVTRALETLTSGQPEILEYGGGDGMTGAMRRADKDGSAWVEYLWYNPCTGKRMPKSSHIIKAGPFFVGVGAYGKLSV